MEPQTTPLKLNLQRDKQLEILWQDGRRSVFTLTFLRSMCPCAQCKAVRGDDKPPEPAKKTSLKILPGNYAEAITVLKAELVGNYAMRIDWSDAHGSGIYSFQYLREISPS